MEAGKKRTSMMVVAVEGAKFFVRGGGRRKEARMKREMFPPSGSGPAA
jgi:hypothetical protein